MSQDRVTISVRSSTRRAFATHAAHAGESLLGYGGVYEYVPKGINRPRHVVVVSAPGILLSPRRHFQGLTVLASHEGDPLTVRITVGGTARYVNATRTKELIRDWCPELVDTLDEETMANIRAALATTFDI